MSEKRDDTNQSEPKIVPIEKITKLIDDGSTFYKEKKYDLAIEACNSAINLAHDNSCLLSSLYSLRSTVYYAEKNYNNAIDDLTNAIKFDDHSIPSNTAILYGQRGLSHGMKGDYDLEIADYTQEIQIYPKAEAYIRRGDVYEEKDNIDLAIADYDSAIQLAPDNAEGYKKRGLMYALINDFQRAIADFEIALKINPDDTFIKGILEMTRLELEKLEE
jgi:tetratricopeptide (TPR) repeat protein